MLVCFQPYTLFLSVIIYLTYFFAEGLKYSVKKVTSLFHGSLSDRIASEVTAQFFQYFPVDLAEHDGAMYLASPEHGQAFERPTAVIVVR